MQTNREAPDNILHRQVFNNPVRGPLYPYLLYLPDCSNVPPILPCSFCFNCGNIHLPHPRVHKIFPLLHGTKGFRHQRHTSKNLSNHQILHRLSLIVRIKRSVHAAERLFFTPSCYICQKCLILHRLNLVCKINKLLLCCFQ